MVSEGEEWKRYRKISVPAFSEVCFTFFRKYPFAVLIHALEKQSTCLGRDMSDHAGSF